ncbi:MAG: pyridoxine 5'-phosphate synthase [Bacteroidetes bacterium]|nr:pyridoxine 5'-phosphate synthase [Bacteroidota bacterium]
MAITNGLKAICLLFVFLMDGDERTIIAAADELLNRIKERLDQLAEYPVMYPNPAEIERAHALGTDQVERYTGPYADAFSNGHADSVLPAYVAAAKAARNLGMGINAGHDLDLDNLGHFLQAVPGVLELSIGQALVADVLLMGLGPAVEAYLGVCRI